MVLIIKVLPADLNTGYEVFVNQRIVAVNHQKIRNLRELVAVVEQPASDPFMVLTTEANAHLVFDRAQAQRDHRQILRPTTWPGIDLKICGDPDSIPAPPSRSCRDIRRLPLAGWRGFGWGTARSRVSLSLHLGSGA